MLDSDNVLCSLSILGIETEDTTERLWAEAQTLRSEKHAANARTSPKELGEVQAEEDPKARHAYEQLS